MNIKELGDLLAHMEDAGFTHRELNNERFRKAAMHLLGVGRRTTSDRDAVIEQCASIAEHTYAKDAFRFELGMEAAHAIRALKTIPADTSREES